MIYRFRFDKWRRNRYYLSGTWALTNNNYPFEKNNDYCYQRYYKKYYAYKTDENTGEEIEYKLY